MKFKHVHTYNLQCTHGLTSFGCCLKNATCHLDAHTVNLKTAIQYILYMYMPKIFQSEFNVHATLVLGHPLEKPIQLMLVPPVWAHKQIHLHHSLVTELDRAQSHSSVVVVVAQSSAEKGVKLVDPWLELIRLAEYFISSYICNSVPQ